MSEKEKSRYSDSELQEFKELIHQKLENARRELSNLQSQLNSSNEHGTDDTANTFKVLEDGSDVNVVLDLIPPGVLSPFVCLPSCSCAPQQRSPHPATTTSFT